MVSIRKDVVTNNEGFLPKGYKKGSSDEGIDALFAELFSLVNLENLEEKSINVDKINIQDNTIQNQILENFINEKAEPTNKLEKKSNENEVTSIKNEDKNEIKAAKSLISVFYKELGFDEENNNDINVVKNNITEEENLNISFLQKDLSTKSAENSNNIITKEKKNFNKKNINIPVSDNLEEKNSFIKSNKEVTSSFEKKEPIIGSHPLNNIKKKQEKISEKKIQKQNNAFDRVKLDITYSEKNKNLNIIDKVSFVSQFKNFTQSSKSDAALTNSEKNNLSKINPNKNLPKDSILNKENESQETLDMLESSWGEKFVRIIKSNINRGINKIDFSVRPKNLGKLKIEIGIEGEKTDIKINTDNKQVANILNENQTKLVEMMDKESLKLGSFSSMAGQNNGSKKHLEKKQDIEQILKTKKNQTNQVSEKITKKTNHNIDINA